MTMNMAYEDLTPIGELDDDLELDFGTVIEDPIDKKNPFDYSDQTKTTPVTEGVNDELFGDANNKSNTDDTLLNELLKSKGIVEGKVIISNEDGKEEEVDFNTLSRQEQLDILSMNTENSLESDLDEEEINLLNYLRSNNLSVTQLLELQREEILKELEASGGISAQNTDTYDIDSFNDQELFLLDLKNKFDLSDEELIAELEKELENETMFQKKVEKLRSEYKELEDNYKEQQAAALESKRQEEFDQFSQTLVDVAIKNPILYDLELDDDEKNETLSSLLELDESGSNEFSKALTNPEVLYRAAWFVKYGEEAFNAIKSDYETQIAQLKRQKDKPGVVVKQAKTTPTPISKPRSIHDVFD